METNPLPPAEALSGQTDARPSRRRRLLFSLGCGCATLLVVVIGGLIWAINYFMGPGVQIPSDYILGPQTLGFVHVAPAADDEAARALFGSLIETLGKLDPETIDGETKPTLRQLVESLQDVDIEAAQEVMDLLPTGLTWALEPGPAPDAELESLGCINLSAGSRLVRRLVLSLAGDENKQEDWGDHTILQVGGDDPELQPDASYLTFQHDTLIFGTSQEILQRVLDRTDFEDEPGPPPSSPLRAELDDLRARWLVSAATGGQEPVPAGFLHSVFGELLAAEPGVDAEDLGWLDVDLGTARAGLGLAGDDLVLRLELLGVPPDQLDALEAGITGSFERLEERLAEDGLEMTHEELLGADSLVLNARLPAFRGWLNAKVEQLARD